MEFFSPLFLHNIMLDLAVTVLKQKQGDPSTPFSPPLHFPSCSLPTGEQRTATACRSWHCPWKLKHSLMAGRELPEPLPKQANHAVVQTCHVEEPG